MKKNIGERLPTFTDEEKTLLKGSIDFLGINHYSSRYVKYRPNSSVPIGFNEDIGALELLYDINGNLIGPASACDWLYVVPWGFGKLLNWIKVRYNNLPIVITENGVPIPNEDTFSLQEIINDNFRINYLSDYID